MIDGFTKFLDQSGANQTIQLTVYLFVLILVIGIVYQVAKYLTVIRHRHLLHKELTPFFSVADVEKAIHIYVPTNYQNISPTEDDEPGRGHIASAKNQLIPLFLKSVFRNDVSNRNKYFLILADSGMGKTTFMINLFLRYKCQWNRFFSSRAHIILLSLASPDAIDIILKVKDKRNTILLLDAFDEDLAAIDDHKTRMREILSATSEFRQIVITCRTQFFPTEEEEPYRTGYFSFGEPSEFKFEKLYISTFNTQDIKTYLRKRFSIFEYRKYGIALDIVKKIPNLAIRPMLLQYSYDLASANRSYDYSVEVYEVLVEKWIERESGKPGVIQKYGSRRTYEEFLYDFSQNLALDMYENRDKRGGFFVNPDEISQSNLQINDISNYSVSKTEIQTKSLINRDAAGRYKFSHKSIFEFFLAKKIFGDPSLFRHFDFLDFKATQIFYDELVRINQRLFSTDKRLEAKQVFGISNQIIASYIDRKHIDNAFNEALKSQKHLIIYGSSKQGKSSLLRKHLSSDRFISIECSPLMKPVDIYSSILRQNGVEFVDKKEKHTGRNFDSHHSRSKCKAKGCNRRSGN